MPSNIFRPQRLDHDTPELLDQTHHRLPSNVRIVHNLVQLLAALTGGMLGAMLCLRRWPSVDAALAGAAVGVGIALFAAALVIRLSSGPKQ